MKILKKVVIAITIFALWTSVVHAQNLNSNNYTLLAPSIDPINNITTSTNYQNLVDSSPVDDYITTSSSYKQKGGTSSFVEAIVPKIQCFETNSTSSTNCSGIPGSNGMQGLCSTLGCYDRAKFEIDTQNNPADVKYAIQVSTDPTFSSNIYYVDPVAHTLKPTLTLSDFLFKCDWEGTVSAGYCGSANITWQKYNLLGLVSNTTYYMRVSALSSSVSTNGEFSQSDWTPVSLAVSTTTQVPSISYDIDIGANTSASNNPAYVLSLGALYGGNVTTSANYIIHRVTSNALSGINTQVQGANGSLNRTVSPVDTISAVNGDLSSLSSGYGLRNDSTTNSQVVTGYLGTITVSSSPNDFTDSGATDKVGAPTTSLVNFFNSNSLPISTGISAYKVKAKPTVSNLAGTYSETLTFIVTGSW